MAYSQGKNFLVQKKIFSTGKMLFQVGELFTLGEGRVSRTGVFLHSVATRNGVYHFSDDDIEGMIKQGILQDSEDT